MNSTEFHLLTGGLYPGPGAVRAVIPGCWWHASFPFIRLPWLWHSETSFYCLPHWDTPLEIVGSECGSFTGLAEVPPRGADARKTRIDHSQVTLRAAVKEQIVCGQEAKTETPAGRSFLISREWVLEHLTCAKVTLGYGHAAWCPDVPGVPHAGGQRRRCSDLGWEGKVSEFSVENVGHLASNQTKGKRWVWSSGRAWCKVQQNGTQIPCLLLPNLEPLTNYT